MSEQQSAPEQLAAGKSQGGAGATYKVLICPEMKNWFDQGRTDLLACLSYIPPCCIHSGWAALCNHCA